MSSRWASQATLALLAFLGQPVIRRAAHAISLSILVFQGSATVVTAVRQFREHAQASRNGPGTDFRAPRPLSRPFGNFASMRKRPETALAPISGLRDRCHGRSAISRACASVQKRPWHRFQGSATVVTAVRQFREHAQASRNGPGTDFRAPRPLSRPFGNFASMRKRPETALAPISGLRDRCHGRSAISRACASVQKRPWHRFQGSATVVTAVRQFREHAQASRNGPGTDFRAPRPLSRPFGNFASMRKRPETALAPISGLRDRCHGRSAISRACASVQKRPWHRFQGSATVVTAVRQFREHAQASRNGPGTDFRAPRPLSRPFGNFASMCMPCHLRVCCLDCDHRSVGCAGLSWSRGLSLPRSPLSGEPSQFTLFRQSLRRRCESFPVVGHSLFVQRPSAARNQWGEDSFKLA